MKRFAAILLLAGCSSLPVPEGPGDPAAEIWSRYADGVDDAEVSVALVKDGVPAFAGDPRTIYRLGGLTDFFVVEAVYRLEDRGEIELDASVAAFAGFPVDPAFEEISLRDLAELRADPLDSADLPVSRLERFVGWTSDARLALFAALIEDVVGKSVEELVRDEIVLPLQLRDTSFMPSADKQPRLATRGERLGGICSSVEDCVKFFASSDRVRSSALLRRRTTRGVSFDWALDRIAGSRRFLAYAADGRDFLLIFRNVTGWSQYRDFKSASETLAP